jgi:hypothetical protein
VMLYPLRQPANPSLARTKIDEWILSLQQATGAERISVEWPVDLPPSRRECP